MNDIQNPAKGDTIAANIRRNANNLHDLLNLAAGIMLDENVSKVVEESTGRNVKETFMRAGKAHMDLVALADKMETRQ